MKTLIFLLLPLFAFSQKQKGFWIKQSSIIAMGLAAGIADGQREVIQSNKWGYRRLHPKANEMWWNPSVSYLNKYADRDKSQGEEFIGSTTVFVGVTDKLHFNQLLRNALFAGQCGVSLSLYEKPNFKQIVIQLAVNWGSYALGKGLTHKFYE